MRKGKVGAEERRSSTVKGRSGAGRLSIPLNAKNALSGAPSESRGASDAGKNARATQGKAANAGEGARATQEVIAVAGKSARATRPVRIGKQTSKKRGELAELEFLRKAVGMGFRVSKPYGDSDRYDFIVDTGERLVRVQVKSSSRLSDEGVYFIASQRCSNGNAIPYKIDEIDYLVAYIFPEDAWFIIPVEAFVPRTSIHLFPRERAEAGMYARYREAWWLLGGTSTGV